ncbi:hypothetical protein AB1Y20_010580 [Prymnesium parvum]|uniref:Uncharacterized protein n=1 Tax=Prymnesium parvum TaxID=97485 RepID=A0AB34IP35_PRYPA|mmetsp:Transcript_27033/g.66937  ORF Transcript_27033/g.66937 Transcript_27033/m.66937 type:complete len:108 (-) Transcript_27033:481-804(-)
MGGSAHLSLTVGTLLIGGGIMGYVRKDSMASLAAGTTFGGLMIGSGLLIQAGRDYEGHVVGAAASGVVAAAMGARFVRSRAFMPAGAVSLLTAASAAYHCKKASEWQ